MHRRLAIPAVLILGSTLMLAAAWVKQRPPSGGWSDAPAVVQAVMWPEPRPVAEFSMHTQHGEPFGRAGLRGQWSFMFYGYLQCPDVCPMTLYAMREFRRELIADDPGAADYRFIFVSVDPAYDSPERMAEYLDFFDPDFVGLAGDHEAVQNLAASMSVMYREFHGDGGTRSIDHTSSIMVIDPGGRTVAALPPPHDPVAMVTQFGELRRYLRVR